jgi:hypothetical protein
MTAATRTLRTSRGDEVLTDLADAEAAALLVLAAPTNDFARDLLAGYQRWGGWTDRQRPWAHRLAMAAADVSGHAPTAAPASASPLAAGELGELFGIELAAPEPVVAAAPEPAPEPAAPGPYASIISLFGRARLRRPALRFSLPCGAELCLARAGERSRYPGQIHASDGGGYGSGRYYGRIDLGGNWRAARDFAGASPELREAILATLAGLAAAPGAYLDAHGRRTGRCSCCARALAADESVRAGIGPVCRQRWGL